jgi:hypothetical protein
MRSAWAQTPPRSRSNHQHRYPHTQHLLLLLLQVMVEKLTPERLSHEFSLGPDAPQVAFRALRQEWIDMGYGVPPESVKQRRGLAPDM